MEATGKVKWYNADKGYGFITTPDGQDVFVHVKQLRVKAPRRLNAGDEVKFVPAEGDRGPVATNVRVTKAAPALAAHPASS